MAAESFSMALRRAFSWFWTSSSCLADRSRSPMFSLDISACFSARSSCFFARSSRPFRFCAWFLRSATSARRLLTSSAAFATVPRTASSWSWSSWRREASLSCISRRLPMVRSAIAIRISTSALFFSSVFRNAFFSASCSCWALISAFICANSSCDRMMASSRCCIACTACSHWPTSSRRCWCKARKSSAVLSSSICLACVSVISASSSACFAVTALRTFSSCKLSSFILASSALVYLRRARLSSSFCRAASAHCSSSSWFQFICSLNLSICSFPLKIEACSDEILSVRSAISCCCFFNSEENRPRSRSASCLRWSSVSISLTLALTSA
mmetsp:Transcript_10387/g.22055  ORF Transcript_10387/g.22055 Transcript_10387/m.22055 type:complete len:329 (+) Transcript_10387:1201-2187(+)